MRPMRAGYRCLLWASLVVAASWPETTRAESTAAAAAAVTAAATSTPSSVASATACPSRTINYITETLPQQCLRTDWSSNATLVSVEPQNGFILITTGSGIGGPTPGPAPSRKPALEQDASSAETYDSAATPNATASSRAAETASTPDPARMTGEEEEDPLSDAVNFVSFEEWKAKMLDKAGHSAESLGKGQKEGAGEVRERRLSGSIHQELDSLGDDAEIEIDFGGFVDPDSVASALPSAKIAGAEETLPAEPDAVAAGASPRSKIAGTTSKDRFNYASLDCAATVRKTNSECKGSNYVLSENKDSYMLNPCAVKNKFFIIELCNDIQIDTIALGNYEFFSSTFRQLRFSISNQFPVKPDKWRDLGIFEAQNRRGVQAFLIENCPTWGRYLRIEVLSHYGAEYYCPISLLRVHGKTMMDDLRNEFKAARGEDDVEEEAAESEKSKVLESTKPKGTEMNEQSQSQIADKDASPEVTGDAVPSPTNASENLVKTGPTPSPNIVAAEQKPFSMLNCKGPGAFTDDCPRTNYFSPLVEQADLLESTCSHDATFCNMELTRRIKAVGRASTWTRPTATPPLQSSSLHGTATKLSVDSGITTTVNPSLSSVLLTSESSKRSGIDTFHGTSQTEASDPSSEAEKSKTDSHTIGPPVSISTGMSASNVTLQSTPRPVAQATPAPAPASEDSFFKSVHKRLQLLEANSTLSLQYIEEQSRLLREAFTKVEKRQLSKTTNFLASLNETVLSELREFRTQYDQIWQSTILELSSQREQSVKEAGALSARLAILADEVLWQKRLVYLQFGLIMLSLVFFVFAQSPAGGEAQRFLEIPALRELLTRSPPASVTRYGNRLRPRASTGASLQPEKRGPFESPPSSPSRPVSQTGLNWARTPISMARSDDGDSDVPLEKILDMNPSPSPGPGPYQSPTPPPESLKANGSVLVNNESQSAAPSSNDLLGPDPDATLRRALSSPALGRDEIQSNDNGDEISSPIDPPRAAELARADTGRGADGNEAGLGLLPL